jgi:hypothetical protein
VKAGVAVVPREVTVRDTGDANGYLDTIAA